MSVTDQNTSAVPTSDAAGEAAMKDWAEMLVDRARAEAVVLWRDDESWRGRSLGRLHLNISVYGYVTKYLGAPRGWPPPRRAHSEAVPLTRPQRTPAVDMM